MNPRIDTNKEIQDDPLSMPATIFSKKANISIDLLAYVIETNKSEELREEARRQYIISSVTGLEVYLKDTFIRIIDEENIDPSHVIKVLKLKLDFLEVLKIRDDKIPTGQILADHFNFQNLKSIDKAFSNLLKGHSIYNKTNFFAEMQEHLKEFKKIYRLKHTDFHATIEDILQLRHECVHNIDFKRSIEKKYLVNCIRGIQGFSVVTEHYIRQIVKNKSTK